MNDPILWYLEVQNLWINQQLKFTPLNDSSIKAIELEKEYCIPSDLCEYFKYLNGTGDDYDENFFRFIGADEFTSAKNHFSDWEGIPDYRKLVMDSAEIDSFFFFGDYQFYSTCFLLKMKRNASKITGVYGCIGPKTWKISSTIPEFMSIYLSSPLSLISPNPPQ